MIANANIIPSLSTNEIELEVDNLRTRRDNAQRGRYEAKHLEGWEKTILAKLELELVARGVTAPYNDLSKAAVERATRPVKAAKRQAVKRRAGLDADIKRIMASDDAVELRELLNEPEIRDTARALGLI